MNSEKPCLLLLIFKRPLWDAFIVARGALTPEDVIEFVRSQVSHYKRVRHVAFIDAIPESASGKILRRVLVDRERASMETASSALT